MSITTGFEERKTLAWEFTGGTHVYGVNDVDQLLSHTRALEDMLRKHEWTHWDGINDVFCRECHGNVPSGHKPDCQLAKLLEGVEP